MPIVEIYVNYTIVQELLQSTSSEGRDQEVPLCRYVVVNPAGKVLEAGTAPYAGNGMFTVDLKGKVPPGLYTILTTFYLHENYLNPEVRSIPYRVEEES